MLFRMIAKRHHFETNPDKRVVLSAAKTVMAWSGYLAAALYARDCTNELRTDLLYRSDERRRAEHSKQAASTPLEPVS